MGKNHDQQNRFPNQFQEDHGNRYSLLKNQNFHGLGFVYYHNRLDDNLHIHFLSCQIEGWFPINDNPHNSKYYELQLVENHFLRVIQEYYLLTMFGKYGI